jgi:adenylate kinase family enzyme
MLRCASRQGQADSAKIASSMRKVVVIASASGNGKTTLGRDLAKRLCVPFIELDAFVHAPNWRETPDRELRARLEPILVSDGW